VILIDVLLAIYAAILILGIVSIFAFVSEYVERHRKQRSWNTVEDILRNQSGRPPFSSSNALEAEETSPPR